MARNAKLKVLVLGEDSEIGKLILTFPCWFCLLHDHEDYREHRHLEVHCDDSFPRLLTELARQLEEALHYRQHFTSDLYVVHINVHVKRRNVFLAGFSFGYRNIFLHYY